MTFGLSFLAPGRLWLLLVPVALLVAYLVLARRRRRYALRYSDLDLLDTVAPDRPGWRRHLPALVLVAGIATAALAVARPAVATEQERQDAVVILAIDTSISMEATDVAPSRQDAAKEAAGAFLAQVPGGVRVGVVAFDGTAREAISPTDNLAAVQRTIDRLTLGPGTAIGEAVFTSLDAIEGAFDTPEEPAGADGDVPAATIVLLSDGETTQGRDNDEAAAEAAQRGIAVNTIAFGTASGTVRTPDGQTVAVPVNREALADLAETTGGRTYPAESAAELREVYEQLGRATTSEPVEREVTDWFAFGALALVAVAATGSLLWFSRLP